jgi:hypothetical protein
LKWIFAGYKDSKNPVQTREKIQFIKLEMSKIRFRWIGD